MSKIDMLWGKLPAFMRGHHVARIPDNAGDVGPDGYTTGHDDAADITEAHVITSVITDEHSAFAKHRPVLDIDFPAHVEPSTTPGHFHLYLDKEIPDLAYWKLIQALSDAGIIENGYANASDARGYTSVRLPWVRKEEKVAAA